MALGDRNNGPATRTSWAAATSETVAIEDTVQRVTRAVLRWEVAMDGCGVMFMALRLGCGIGWWPRETIG